jgi:hypothetical protein
LAEIGLLEPTPVVVANPLIVMEKGWVPAGATPLLTVVVPVYRPRAFGVPEMTPAALRVKGGGRAPAVTL